MKIANEAKGLEIVDYVTEEEKPKKEVAKKEAKAEKVAEVKEEVVEEVVETEEVVESDLTNKTVTELRNLAKEAGVKGYSTMKKDELISSLS